MGAETLPIAVRVALEASWQSGMTDHRFVAAVGFGEDENRGKHRVHGYRLSVDGEFFTNEDLILSEMNDDRISPFTVVDSVKIHADLSTIDKSSLEMEIPVPWMVAPVLKTDVYDVDFIWVLMARRPHGRWKEPVIQDILDVAYTAAGESKDVAEWRRENLRDKLYEVWEDRFETGPGKWRHALERWLENCPADRLEGADWLVGPLRDVEDAPPGILKLERKI